MPYPNEHAARVRQPSDFIDGSFRRKVIKQGITVILGKLKPDSDTMTAQAYRFNIRYFSASDAREWLKSHDIEYMSFEPAKETEETKTAPDENELRLQSDLKEEFRFITDRDYLNRSVFNDDGDEQIFVDGVGIVYNAKTEIYPGVTESIEPGAFSESLASFRTVKSFINHNPTQILSTTRSAPALEILDSENFLEFSAPIPPTSYGSDLVVNLKRGNIKGASFSFSISENGDHYRKNADGTLHRTIVKAEIYEVGPVTNPAYEQTEVGLRSKEFFEKVFKSLETKDHSNKELEEIKSFLSQRKGV